jgi:hypothetical protein
MAWVRERTIPTERLQFVGEVSANVWGQRVLRGQRDGSPTAVFSIFLDRTRYFPFQVALQLYSEAEWSPFQTLYFSENLVLPGIESEPLDL